MFTYKVETIISGEYVELTGWQRPIYDTSTLDESLDSGKITFSLYETSGVLFPKLKPFMPLFFTIYEDGVQKDFISRCIIKVKRTKKTFTAPIYYNVTCNIIEWTKLIERDICDTLTFTNYLGHDYLSGAILVNPVFSGGTAFIAPISPLPIYTPILEQESTIEVPAIASWFHFTSGSPGYVYSWNYDYSNTTIIAPDATTSVFTDLTVAPDYAFNQHGEYTIIYNVYYNINGVPSSGHTYTYTLYTTVNIEPKVDWTIGAVIRRILSSGKTRRSNDTQKFIFTDTLYDTMPSPEFYIIQMTMFEALLEVGKYLHAIPRLNFDKTLYDSGVMGYITFDKLGGNTKLTIAEELMYEEQEVDGDDYCGTIDSTVQNIITTVDTGIGSLSYPAYGGNITTRSETVRISNDTAIIGEFQDPIYKHADLTCTIGSVTKSIKPYLYEEAEYETLSSFTGTPFPYSKAYAITYKQGDNKITGLSFKVEDSTTPATAWQRPAIVNIINAAFGAGTITWSGTNWSIPFKDLKFNFVYIPVISARVTQKKPYLTHPLDNTIIYNQVGGTVESSYYGENLKGAIARLGNETLVRTYEFKTYDNIPQVGEILEVDGVNYYIAIVSKELEQTIIKVTLTMTPYFNRLSSYLGINSNYRISDASEKKSYNRFINYGEVCLVGNEVTGTVNNAPLLTAIAMEVCRLTLYQGESFDNYQVTFALMKGTVGSTEMKQILLPVNSIPAGNSLVFEFNCTDNFGAGHQSVYYDANNNVRHAVPYGDSFGEFTTLSVQLGYDLSQLSLPSGYENELPEFNGSFPVPLFQILLNTDEYPFIIDLNSTEVPIITLQQHFVANRNTIVMGQLLQKNNPLVNPNSGTVPKAYGFTTEFNMLDSKLDLSTGIEIASTITTGSTSTGYYTNQITNSTETTFKSWAICDENGYIYLGENMTIAPNGTTNRIYFNYLDNENLRRATT